jgi:murein DD-endopeptidase MepM/ murein hydrolase activator NlpD
LLYAPVVRPVDYLELTAEQSSVLTEQATATEIAIRASQFASFDQGKHWTARFVRPLIGPQTTAFGEGRSINGGPVGGFHTGMDIGADAGTPVHASADGRVSSVVRMPIRGLSVVIDHGAGVKSGYHHLEATLVHEGDAIVQGQVVGMVGSTGLSTGPHLHWEVTVWGVNVDPLQWTTASFEP